MNSKVEQKKDEMTISIPDRTIDELYSVHNPKHYRIDLSQSCIPMIENHRAFRKYRYQRFPRFF